MKHNRGGMKEKEVKAQTGKMIKQHERMMSGHKEIRTHFQTIKDDHEKVMEALTEKGE